MEYFTLILFFKLFLLMKLGETVRHTRNLVWSMSPIVKGKARIVGIEGDPNDWVTSGNVTVRHISAPRPGWQFRGIAYSYELKMLFWGEKSKKKILGLKLDGSTSTETIFTGTSEAIDGLAVDWISNNLYSADPKYNWIMMIALNKTESIYRVVVKTNLANPHGLAVYPQKGYLFWSDWGLYPKIEVSDLLGLNRRTLVSESLLSPRGLAIDYSSNVLYWVDGMKNTIESVELNGNSRRIILSSNGAKFFGIALFQKYMFVTEQLDGHLRVFDRYTGKGYINYQLGYMPYGIIMYDEDSQKGNSLNVTAECQAMDCEHICVNDPATGPKCICGDGYEMQEDGKSCTASKSFAQPSHIYAIRNAICQYPANLGHMSLKDITLEKQCFIKTNKGFLALAFDGSRKTLYYSENVTNSISKVQLKKGEYTSTIIRGVGEVKGLAYDWMTQNLYWTDNTYKWIMVARPDGRYQKKLITDNLLEPLGIVVHPKRGELYWSDPGRSVIEVSALNGGGRQALPIADIIHPNHLFMDFWKDKLYWADSGRNQISSYDLDLKSINVVYRQQSSSFFGISIFQDYLVWTDQNDRNGIHIADMETQSKVRGILHPQTGLAHDVIAYDIHNQPMLDVTCGDDNGCQQLCLGLYNESYVCACGTGYRLDVDLKTCVTGSTTDNFLLTADSHQKHIYQVSLLNGQVNAMIPKIEQFRPIAIGYDPVRSKMFWTDNDLRLIQEAYVGGESVSTVKFLPEESVIDGLAVDHINRLLYYTDTGLNRIQVISLDNYKICKTIISQDLDEPRAIAIHPIKGQMFWSDWGHDPKIESAYMDGTNRKLIVNLTEDSWPNGIVIDYNDDMMYWIDARLDMVEAIRIDGSERRIVLKDQNAHYFGITLNGNDLIITDWKINYLKSVSKFTNNGTTENIKKIGPQSFARLNGVIAFNSSYLLKGISGCSRTFKCHQICIPLPRMNYVCACADGYKSDGYKCKRTDQNATLIEPNEFYQSEAGAYKTNISGGLSKGGIIAIAVVCVIALIIAATIIVFIFSRWRSRFVKHERLVDENQVDNFYRISFPDKQQESVDFDRREDMSD